jgi:hypothetical protein
VDDPRPAAVQHVAALKLPLAEDRLVPLQARRGSV